MAVGADTFAQLFSAWRAANEQQQGIEDWQNKLNELVSNFSIDWEPTWTFVDPLADPALSGITNDILLSLGQPATGVGLRGGPMDQVISLAGATGGDVASSLGGVLRHYKKTGKVRGWGPDEENEMPLRGAVRKAGYTTLQDLMEAQVQWEEEQARYADESSGTAQAIREGRLAGFENLAQMLKDYPTPLSERSTYEDALYAEIERDRAIEERAIMEAANAYGVNPSGPLGELAAQTTLERSQARADAITRALEYMAGYNTGIEGLQAGLLPAQEAGLTLSGQRSTGLSNLGQTAANQANVINQITGNISMAEAIYPLMAQLGFPAEYLSSLVEANKWNTTGAVTGEALDLSRDIQDWISVLSALKGGGGGTGSSSTPYSSPLTQGSSGPATSGKGWPGSAYWAGTNP